MRRDEKHWKRLFYILKGVLWFNGERFRVIRRRRVEFGIFRRLEFLCPDDWCTEQIGILKQLRARLGRLKKDEQCLNVR